MHGSRRDFLKLAGVTAMGLSAATLGLLGDGAQAADALPQAADFANPLTAKRWAMVIDTAKLDEDTMEKCIHACHSFHNVPEIAGKQTIKWLWKDEFEATFPSERPDYLSEDVKKREFLLLCNHCTNPPCVRVCPTKATFQRPDGLVAMDYHRCIGCRYCMAACPFGARSFNFQDPAPFIKEVNPIYPHRTRGVVEKCTFCVEHLAQGKLPLCVEASEGAMIFGDLQDPNSDVRKVLKEKFAIRRKPELGTEPGVFYIL